MVAAAPLGSEAARFQGSLLFTPFALLEKEGEQRIFCVSLIGGLILSPHLHPQESLDVTHVFSVKQTASIVFCWGGGGVPLRNVPSFFFFFYPWRGRFNPWLPEQTLIKLLMKAILRNQNVKVERARWKPRLCLFALWSKAPEVPQNQGMNLGVSTDTQQRLLNSSRGGSLLPVVFSSCQWRLSFAEWTVGMVSTPKSYMFHPLWSSLNLFRITEGHFRWGESDMRWCLGSTGDKDREHSPPPPPILSGVASSLQLASSAVVLWFGVVRGIGALLAHCQTKHHKVRVYRL